MKRKFLDTIHSEEEKSHISLNALYAEELGEYAKLPVPNLIFTPISRHYANKNFDVQPFYKHISRVIENSYDDE